MAAALRRGLGFTAIVLVEIATIAGVGLFLGAVVIWAGILTGAM